MKMYPVLGRKFLIKRLAVFYLCFAVASCSDEESNPLENLNEGDDPIQAVEAISETVGRLEIRVDPRIELINIVESAKLFEEKRLQEPMPSPRRRFRPHPSVR